MCEAHNVAIALLSGCSTASPIKSSLQGEDLVLLMMTTALGTVHSTHLGAQEGCTGKTQGANHSACAVLGSPAYVGSSPLSSQMVLTTLVGLRT
jgi:hypothetical protein